MLPMPSAEAPAQSIVEAASVIVFRHQPGELPELLMVKRSKSLSFAASAVVFPGGKVTPADLALASGDAEQGARIAAVRETLEETGLLLCAYPRPTAEQAKAARAMLARDEDMAPVLDRFGWSLELDKLTAFARWLPDFKPGRIFDTRFYLSDIGSGAIDLEPDREENTQLFWISAQSALDGIATGKIQAIYPTRRNLERLALFADVNEAFRHAIATPAQIIRPKIRNVNGQDMLVIPRDSGYPINIAPLSQIKLR
ncbi:NUDIX domain-containing protein [Novosphingobium piscinae]|uniref:NUDIX domain-containing protein n=1 Tax=Novosphingobium piscinae TaxID=1507448 RepID=A0A7X1KQ35_9SPHN|nr:NUDIX domain-containing protein [Novosphingobium piscinae]MBC2669311.1 NUDIX domain-containing protein [Novosphingobium piscinae]